MHYSRATLLLLLASPTTLASQDAEPAAPLPSIQLPGAFDRVLRDYEAAWQRHDAAQLASLFAIDGFILPSGRVPVRGRAAIAQAYASAGGALWLRALAYSTADSIGYIIGAYGYGPTPPVPDRGKFVLALRRGPDGRWLIMADIDNGNRDE